MARKKFTFKDFCSECHLLQSGYEIDGKVFGLKVFIPDEIKNTFPYNASAYDFMQYFRQEIFENGTIEFPNLPVNKTNHTVALKAPQEHSYSSNPFLTEPCQRPHQDTPPYPTAFWLDNVREYFATWVMGEKEMNHFFYYAQQNPAKTLEEIHQDLVSKSLKNKTGILLNHQPGLLLIDNSSAHNLYHARTCNFKSIEKNPSFTKDSPLYAFNEVGLMNYIDTIDSQRGAAFRDDNEKREVMKFMQAETV